MRVFLGLAIARAVGKPLVPLTVLAEAERIPVHFLEQILFSLRQAGHLQSTRGKHGGYSLVEASAALKIGDILRFLEGPLAPIACASLTGYQRCTCADEATCGIRRMMLEAREALSKVFDTISLQDLAQRTLADYAAANATPPIVASLEVGTRPRAAKTGTEPDYVI